MASEDIRAYLAQLLAHSRQLCIESRELRRTSHALRQRVQSVCTKAALLVCDPRPPAHRQVSGGPCEEMLYGRARPSDLESGSADADPAQ